MCSLGWNGGVKGTRMSSHNHKQSHNQNWYQCCHGNNPDRWQRVMKARARSFLIILLFPSPPAEEVILLQGRHQLWRVSRLHSGPTIVFFKQNVPPHAHYGSFFHFCMSNVDKTHRQLVAWHGNYRLSTFHHFKIKIVSHLKPVELYFWQSS